MGHGAGACRGGQLRDTRYTGAPADIESPPRLIEVKSFGTSNWEVFSTRPIKSSR